MKNSDRVKRLSDPLTATNPCWSYNCVQEIGYRFCLKRALTPCKYHILPCPNYEILLHIYEVFPLFANNR
jgi:hypothetical protein